MSTDRVRVGDRVKVTGLVSTFAVGEEAEVVAVSLANGVPYSFRIAHVGANGKLLSRLGCHAAVPADITGAKK